ncbi:sensor histidine kinase [Pseudobdellovibrio sp. HCB154]|uniref:sensor histidine kinase n=1 Tax=Pseudobdellovibrio sp. HCB154 TaxID=3386277 RepID=UPI003917037B
MMTIRSKLMFVFSSFAVVAVLAGSGFVLQKAIAEKSSYVNELNSLLVPQLRSEVDQRLRSLAILLNQYSAAPSKTKFSKSQLETLISSIKSSAPYVDALVLTNTANGNLAIQINTSDDVGTRTENLIKDLQFKNKLDVTANKFQISKDAFALYRAPGGHLVGLVFNTKEFLALTEYSRGKDSYIVNSNNEVLFSNVLHGSAANFFPSLNLVGTGATIVGTDVPWANGKTRSAFFTRSEMITNASVLMVEDKVSWLTIATPLLNSTISVLFILIIAAFAAALWLAKSLAAPIETLTEQAAKVGLGDWKAIFLKASTVEIAKLTSAFNAMIENLQRRERDLTLANQKIVRTESLAAVGRIGAGVAHEVKNPLASILSYAQLLEMQINAAQKVEPPSAGPEKIEKIKNYNSMILDDTRRATRIINDLLTFARQKEIQTESVRVEEYVSSLKEKLSPLCQQNGIQFSTVVDVSSADAQISVDREQIYQVIYNLVQNATHALAEIDSPNKKIELSAKVQDSSVCLAIEDNGSGIKPENLEKIFEPFFSTKKMGQGSGLGLAISYGIMQMHGGQIQVKSSINVGTTFTLVFPKEK